MKIGKVITSVLVCALLFTGCGSSAVMTDNAYYESTAQYDGGFNGAVAETNGIVQGSITKSVSPLYDNAETGMAVEYAEYDSVPEMAHKVDNAKKDDMPKQAAEQEIQREMLIYTCNMSIDVLKFDEAVSSFKAQVEEVGGFVEFESYTDGGRSYQWYDADAEKWQKYTATVRIPSEQYNAFCGSVGEIGDLRNKEANVENVSQEYYDLGTELAIYEAKEQRYITMLSTIQDDEYAIAVEKELTEVQVHIAKLRTRMNTISTDVAYSTIYVNINEVKEYRATPVQKDTFWQRLWNTITETGTGFVMFLENLLFAVISVLPYALIIGAVVFIAVKVYRKKMGKAKIKLGAKKSDIKRNIKNDTTSETETGTKE